MLDFIKNNKIIFGAVFIITVILLLLVMLFFVGGTAEPTTSDVQTFPDTNDNNNTSSNSDDAFLFGTSSERFVPDVDEGGEVPDFRAITKTPVIAATIIEKSKDDSLAQYVRYTSRLNGHIFDIPLTTLGEEVIVSNKTILRIGNSEWSQNGSSTFSRYFDEDNTKMFAYVNYVALGTSSESVLTPYDFVGRPIVDTIQDIAFSPKGDEFFYLVITKEGTVGYLENTQTGTKKQVWTSLLKNLSVSWNSQNSIVVYTNPSSITEGVVWLINPKTNKSTVVLAKNLALAAKTNPSGTKILYSLQESKNSVFSLRILDIETGKINHLPIATMVEKCTWGPISSKYIYCAIPRKEISGEMLEGWYMGTFGSDDELWRIDSATGVVKRLIDPFEETKEKFDITDIVVSQKEDYVIFKTRVNSVLWALKLPTKAPVESEDEVLDVDA